MATIVVRSGTKNSDGSCVHMMPLFSEIIDFYANAREYCVKAGFQWEIDAVQNRYFKNIDIGDFLEAYVFCVFNV